MPIQPMAKKVPCECRRATRGTAEKICDECQRRECFEWQWEKDGTGTTVVFSNNDRDVIFNPGFSVGTAAVRGTVALKPGYHHYWEIEMSTEVYGTDMMIGVGTDKTDLRKYSHNFVSLLGIDEQSWGLSYSGEKKHGGQSNQYTKPFGQNSIIGVHLDLWAGTLEFYVDRKPLGLAFEGLRDKVLYPVITSTAARSGMNLIFCRSYPQSLQLQTMLMISKNLLCPMEEENASLFKVLTLPPGLKAWMKNNYWWIVSSRDRDRKREEQLNNRSKCIKNTRKQKSNHTLHAQQVENANDVESESDDEFDASITGSCMESTRRQGRRRMPQQCSQATHGECSDGGTSCMQYLAATSSRAHFLGRVSPIFVGLPEGGFNVYSDDPPSVHVSPIVTGPLLVSNPSSSTTQPLPSRNQPTPSPKPSTSTVPSPNQSKPVAVVRSRSAPAQPCSSLGAASHQPSSSDDEEDSNDSSATHSARKEPKRLRLRDSIEADGNKDENVKEKVADTDE